MKQPVAYLRKSKVTSARHVSWEVQEAEVRALAASHGDTDLLLLSDWSKSGRGSKTRLRGEYARLKEMIGANQVSVLYSYSLSRLSRSLREYVRLAEMCEAHGVPIRLAKEGSLDYSTVSGRLLTHILAAAAQAEAEWGQERAADAVRARRERGDHLGIPPYGWRHAGGRLVREPTEPLEPIVAAFEQAGSCFGAARLLNEAGSRTRRGALWTSKVIGDILEREGVIYKRRPHPGVKAAADWVFYRLLVCPCGIVMTGMDRRAPRYTCYRARHDPHHARPFGIAESRLLPAIMAEAERFRPIAAVEMSEADERRAGIAARRERVLDLFVSGLVDKADRDRRLSALDDEAERLDAETRVVEVPDRIDWTAWRPSEINTVLRALWERIDLGPELLPVRFVWRVPEWRA